MAKKLDWVVYWVGNVPTATWVSRSKAKKLAADPNVEVARWIRA